MSLPPFGKSVIFGKIFTSMAFRGTDWLAGPRSTPNAFLGVWDLGTALACHICHIMWQGNLTSPPSIIGMLQGLMSIPGGWMSDHPDAFVVPFFFVLWPRFIYLWRQLAYIGQPWAVIQFRICEAFSGLPETFLLYIFDTIAHLPCSFCLFLFVFGCAPLQNNSIECWLGLSCFSTNLAPDTYDSKISQVR